jgi:hypothetical protein
MRFLKLRYRINMPTSQGSITPIASSATAIQRGGRLPLPIPCKIAMISATNAQANVIGGITSRSFFSCESYHALESLVATPNNLIPREKRNVALNPRRAVYRVPNSLYRVLERGTDARRKVASPTPIPRSDKTYQDVAEESPQTERTWRISATPTVLSSYFSPVAGAAKVNRVASTSLTFRASAFGENGFCRNAKPGSKTPWWTMVSSV